MQKFQGIILTKLRNQLLWAFAFIVAASVAGTALAAGKSKSDASGTQPEDVPIQITANQLISNNEEKYAEFIGNVKANQADFEITSEKLRIYYEGDLMSGEKNSNEGQDMLKKIVATGNVKIKSDKYNAETEVAEYDTATMTIILTGENSKVISGKNSITGAKIILYRKEGRFKVEGSKNKRIKAVFYSEGKASDAFKIEKPQN